MVNANSNTTRRNWERTYNIDLDATTKNSLWQTMKNERAYHNTLVNELNSKLRVLSNEILNIKDQYERLWAAVAQTATKLRAISSKPLDAWPEELRPFKDIIAKEGKLIMNERLLVIYDIAAAEADIHPHMRRAIATEILKWIQPQAKSMLSLTTNTSGQMSMPLHMLQPLTTKNKRHVQLLGTLASITYDNVQKVSTIKIPYSSVDIKVHNQDLTKMPSDNIIIRQTPGQDTNVATPWQITIKEGTGRYMIDFVDVTYDVKPKRKSR